MFAITQNSLLCFLNTLFCFYSIYLPVLYLHTSCLFFYYVLLLSPHLSLTLLLSMLCISNSLFTFSLTFFFTHLLLFSSLSSSPPLCRPHQCSRSLVSLVSQLAQRTGRHMGGLFCNPAGHTTLAQEKGGLMGCTEGGEGVREDLEGLYYYLPTYTFSASLRLQADGLSLFFPHRRRGLASLHPLCEFEVLRRR